MRGTLARHHNSSHGQQAIAWLRMAYSILRPTRISRPQREPDHHCWCEPMEAPLATTFLTLISSCSILQVAALLSSLWTIVVAQALAEPTATYCKRCRCCTLGRYTHTYTCTHTHAHTHSHTLTHACTRTCTRACACAHTQTQTHTHTYKHTHTSTIWKHRDMGSDIKAILCVMELGYGCLCVMRSCCIGAEYLILKGYTICCLWWNSF